MFIKVSTVQFSLRYVCKTVAYSHLLVKIELLNNRESCILVEVRKCLFRWSYESSPPS